MNCRRILLQDSISDFIKWKKNINHIHSNKRTCSNKPTPCNVHKRTFAGLAYWYMTPSFTHRHRIRHIKTLKLNHQCLNIFLAHLSRRLTGELIVYPCSGVRPSVVHPSSTISKIFSSETAWPIKAKLHVEHP